jgi:RimK family alpha-L-glutamate ligase
MTTSRAQPNIGIVTDRIGYEERLLIDAARAQGVTAQWIDDGRLCAGPRAGGVPDCKTYLIRSRAYTRGAIIAGLLEDRDERTVNSCAAIELCQSKLDAARALHAASVPTIDFRVVLSRADLHAAIEQLGLPLVLKPLLGGFGRRVLLIRDADLAHSAYDYVEHYAQSHDRVMLAQPFQAGADLRAIVAGGTVIAAIEREPTADWRGNVALGARPVAVAPMRALHELALRVTALTGAEIVGLDAFCDGERLIVNEINHVPQFRGVHEATGIDVAGAIVRHLANVPGVSQAEPPTAVRAVASVT